MFYFLCFSHVALWGCECLIKKLRSDSENISRHLPILTKSAEVKGISKLNSSRQWKRFVLDLIYQQRQENVWVWFRCGRNCNLNMRGLWKNFWGGKKIKEILEKVFQFMLKLSCSISFYREKLVSFEAVVYVKIIHKCISLT